MVGKLAHGRHAGHPDRTDQPAVIEQVRLHDIGHAVPDHRLEPRVTEFLLAQSDGYRECLGDSSGIVKIVEGAGFLEIHGVDILQHAADGDRMSRVVRAIRVGVQSDFVSQRFPREWDERFRASRRGVFVAAHPAAHAVLHGFAPVSSINRLR